MKSRALVISFAIAVALACVVFFNETTPMSAVTIKAAIGGSFSEFKSLESNRIHPGDFMCSPEGMCVVAKTVDSDIEVSGVDKFTIKGVRYFGLQSEDDVIVQIDGGASLKTLDGALADYAVWVAEIERSGMMKSPLMTANLYSVQKKVSFNSLAEAKRALLGDGDINGLTLSEFTSAGARNTIRISIEHKREDGGPRYPGSPVSNRPLEEEAYQLTISIAYEDLDHGAPHQ